MVGTKVIIRSHMSGVWHGELVELEGNRATLANARRLWRFWAGEGVSVSGVAAAGLRADRKSIVAACVEKAIVFDVIEVLSASEQASASIEAYPVEVER